MKLKLKLQQIFSEKIPLKLISTNFFTRKIFSQSKHKRNKTKAKPTKLKLKLQQIFSGKVPLKLISTIFFTRKIFSQNKHKRNKTKTKPMKSKLLKTLSMNQFQANWSFDFIYSDF